MERTQLTHTDRELIQEAVDASDRLYVEGVHEVAAAVRTGTGLVFSAIHIESPMGWADVCGEVAAICCMVAAGHRDLETVVAVWRSPEGEHFILSPCGRCRELMFDLNRNTWVVVGTLDEPYKVRLSDLLPLRTWDSG